MFGPVHGTGYEFICTTMWVSQRQYFMNSLVEREWSGLFNWLQNSGTKATKKHKIEPARVLAYTSIRIIIIIRYTDAYRRNHFVFFPIEFKLKFEQKRVQREMSNWSLASLSLAPAHAKHILIYHLKEIIIFNGTIFPFVHFFFLFSLFCWCSSLN